MKTKISIRKHAAPATLALALAVGALYARAGDIVGEAKLGTPPAVRAMVSSTAVGQ